MIEIIEKMHAGHFTCLPQELGFEVSTFNQLRVVNCRLGSSMFNLVYGGLIEITEDLIFQVIEQFNSQPFAWWIPPSQYDPKLTALLQRLGFKKEAQEQAMYCDLSQELSLASTTYLKVKQVEDSSTLNAFIELIKAYDPTVESFYRRIGNFSKSQEKLFVGFFQEEPAVIGILYFEENSSSIFSLITKEKLRGKGLGTDMMKHLIRFSKDRGVKLITLSASSDEGLRIYERLGFEALGAFECFEYPGAMFARP